MKTSTLLKWYDTIGGIKHVATGAVNGLLAGFVVIVLAVIPLWSDAAPVFTNLPLTVGISSDIANGSTVATVNATYNKPIVYTITGGNNSGAFAINTSTGVITVTDHTRLANGNTALTIMVTDSSNANKFMTGTLTVQVTDANHAPVASPLSISVAWPSATATGTLITDVNATDTDGDQLSYAITAGNTNSTFNIESATGKIYLEQTLSTALSPYTLTVTVTDSHGATATATVTVNVGTVANHAPVVSPASMSATLSSSAVAGTAVMDVNATDSDNDTLTYTITSGNIDNVFAINSSTGVIAVLGTPSVAISPYVLTVTVSDGKGGSATATVNVTVTSGIGDMPNPDQCGMFPSVLAAQNNITTATSAPIYCALQDPGNVNNDVTVLNVLTVNAQSADVQTDKCQVLAPPPPLTLPTFVSTSVTTTQTISSSSVTFSSAEIGNISIDNGAKTLTFTPTDQPYGNTTRRVMKIGNVVDNGQNNLVYVFNEGDYWIKGWNMTGNNAEIRINGRVRFFVEGDFTANSNGLTINASPTSGVASNFYLYGYHNVALTSSGNSKFEIYGYVYAQNDFVAAGNSNNQYFTGAFRAGNNIVLEQNQRFTYDKSGINGGADNCIVPNYTRVGLFDAWDLDRSITDRKISTKISSQPFALAIASLNAANTAIETKASGTKAYYRLFDFQANTPKTDYIQYDPSLNASIVSSSLTVGSAHKNMKVEFKFCADDTGTAFILKPDSECSGMSVCTQTNRTCYRETVSTDAFAIRPNQFTIDGVATPNLLKAGETYGFSLYANPYGATGTTGTPDYNQTSTNLTITAIKRMHDGSVNPDLNGTASFPNAFTVFNGVATDVNKTFSDVGRITVDLNDTEWTSVDASDTALVDRTIHGAANYTYIPFRFAISNARIVDSRDGNFTYLATDDLVHMSAKLDFNVASQNKQGGTTLNFTAGRYENPVTILPAVFDPVGGDANETNITASAIGFASGTTHLVWNDTNASRVLSFNFTRPANPIDPFTADPTDVNITLSSSYTDGGTTVVIENNATNINGSTNGMIGNATMLYGRVDAPDYRFTNASGCGRVYFEFYNTVANNPIIATAFGTMPPLSLSPDRNWYQNTQHNTATDGSVTTFAGSHIDATGTTGCMGAAGLGTQKRTFIYDTQPGYPYRATMSMDASDWLDTPNSNFGVEYRQAGAWIGVQSETTTKTDANSELNSNRRVTW